MIRSWRNGEFPASLIGAGISSEYRPSTHFMLLKPGHQSPEKDRAGISVRIGTIDKICSQATFDCLSWRLKHQLPIDDVHSLFGSVEMGFVYEN